jgi:hypothetical protein
MLGPFALTLGIMRAVNYWREQRAPTRLVKDVSGSPYRVHHYVPGIALGFTSGVVAAVSQRSELKPWLGIGLGSGMAMTLDEAAMLLEREDLYWNNEVFPLAEGIGAIAGSAAIATRFLRRGEQEIRLTKTDGRQVSQDGGGAK